MAEQGFELRHVCLGINDHQASHALSADGFVVLGPACRKNLVPDGTRELADVNGRQRRLVKDLLDGLQQEVLLAALLLH